MEPSKPQNAVGRATKYSLASIDIHLADPWPKAHYESLRGLRQGFIVHSPPFAYARGEGDHFWSPPEEAIDTLESAVALKAGFEPKYGVITTQTCDIVDHAQKRPWIQVCPVFRLENPEVKTIERGWHKSFWHVPGVPDEGYWVADLRVEIPVEKNWIAARAADLVDGFPDHESRRNFANALARKVARPAIPDDVIDRLAKPLVEAIRALKKSDKQLYDEIQRYVDHFCLYLEPNDISPSKVTLVAITEEPEEGEGTRPTERAARWLIKFTSDLCDTELPFEFPGIDFERRDQITYADHAEMVEVDVHRLSQFEGLEDMA